MDAVRFIKERNRMCKSLDVRCEVCPAFHVGENGAQCAVGAASMLDAKEQIAIVEKWSIEHPKKKKKTRQEVFLKQYPEARIGDNGYICLCPGDVFDVYRDAYGNCAKPDAFCPNCRKDFWMAEVEEDK